MINEYCHMNGTVMKSYTLSTFHPTLTMTMLPVTDFAIEAAVFGEKRL